METATVEPREATEAATGSRTVADLFPLAIQKHGPQRAVIYRDEATGEWAERTYSEVGEIVRGLSLGLMDLGIEKGDKVAILANTRPEWTYFDFAALSVGATVVPIYQTNSPEECEYVLENSDARAVIVEDEAQLAKIDEIRARVPKLEHVIRMEGTGGGAVSMDELVERGAARSESEWEQRWQSVTPDDTCTFIYTSGTTGPPRGA
jgi:long-chain acyl-CoA synthetase